MQVKHSYPVLRRSLTGILGRVFAAIGVLAVILLIVAWYRGSTALHDMTPSEIEEFGRLSQRILATNLASASVIRLPVDAGISRADSVKAMQRRAAERHLPLQRQHRWTVTSNTAKGKSVVEVYDLCTPELLSAILKLNVDLYAHSPCSIVLIHSDNGGAWVIAADSRQLLQGGTRVPAATKKLMAEFRESLLAILSAGASG